MRQVSEIIKLLRVHTKKFQQPLIDIIIQEYEGNALRQKKPFLILIGCLLSLRSKDIVTIHVCRNLFELAQTPQELLAIEIDDLEKIIYKVGFYKNKAKVLHEVSRTLIEKHNGRVPDTEEELLKIKGIGRKTANLVLGLAFGKPAICVDTHVHRISNRLGLVNEAQPPTPKTPAETERALKKLLPKKHWIEWNRLLVIWGQNICLPRGPKCDSCALKNLCDFSLNT